MEVACGLFETIEYVDRPGERRVWFSAQRLQRTAPPNVH